MENVLQELLGRSLESFVFKKYRKKSTVVTILIIPESCKNLKFERTEVRNSQ